RSKMPPGIAEAATHASHHRAEILSSSVCGCYCCLELFKPVKITDWLVSGTCAICPKCGIDAVIGDNSGFPITKESLTSMHKYWFGNPKPLH
ncbi:MAG TPA: hypothetical protein VGF75_07305, partial [Candidatus Saccharimonadales bacterium]